MSKTKHRIIGWTQYDKNQKEFNPIDDEDWADAEQAIVDVLKENGYKFGGNYHQYGETGTPVLEDGRTFMVSFRSWGELVSRAFGGSYMDYAWMDEYNDGYNVPKKAIDISKVAYLSSEEIVQQEAKESAALKDYEMYRLEQEEKQKKYEEDFFQEVSQFLTDHFAGKNLDDESVNNAIANIIFHVYKTPYSLNMTPKKLKEFLEEFLVEK